MNSLWYPNGGRLLKERKNDYDHGKNFDRAGYNILRERTVSPGDYMSKRRNFDP